MRPSRWLFLVDADGLHDAAMRTLAPFAVHGAVLARLDLQRVGDGVRLRIEAEGVDDIRAGALQRKLGGLPFVRSVSLGWVSAEGAAAPPEGPR